MFKNWRKLITTKNVIIIVAICLLIALGYIGRFIYKHIQFKNKATKITYSEALTKLDSGFVYKIEVDNDRMFLYETSQSELSALINKTDDKHCNLYAVEKIENTTDLMTKMAEHTKITVEKDPLKGNVICLLIFLVAPVCVVGGIAIHKVSHRFALVSKTKDGKPKKSKYNQSDKVTFKDVAGCDEAKESLVEMVDFLKNPAKYTKIGAKLPKGALMVGSPGCGKTLLAKAVAGEADVPFLYKSASEFIEMYVGVGAKRIRELFSEAKSHCPCIVFIDEIDAIGTSRGQERSGGDEEKNQTLNQLLTEMDGFSGNNGIIVIGATNRPEVLDQALLRPGRFDRQIIVDKPDLKGRINILKVHAKEVKLEKDVNFEEIGLLTSGCSGADLSNIINEAAINAVKEKRNKVRQSDLKKCIEIVLVGQEKKDRKLNDKEKRIVAFHECGHAFLSYLQYKKSPIQTISIIPTVSGALGYVANAPTDEKYLKSKSEMIKEIKVCLAGRAAEEILLGKDEVTGGCSNDLEKAASTITQMVTQLGMGKQGLYAVVRQNNKYLGNNSQMTCSSNMQYDIDKEIQQKLKTYYDEVLMALKNNWEPLREIAEYLEKQERLTGDEFLHLLKGYKLVYEN